MSIQCVKERIARGREREREVGKLVQILLLKGLLPHIRTTIVQYFCCRKRKAKKSSHLSVPLPPMSKRSQTRFHSRLLLLLLLLIFFGRGKMRMRRKRVWTSSSLPSPSQGDPEMFGRFVPKTTRSPLSWKRVLAAAAAAVYLLLSLWVTLASLSPSAPHLFSPRRPFPPPL